MILLVQGPRMRIFFWLRFVSFRST